MRQIQLKGTVLHKGKVLCDNDLMELLRTCTDKPEQLSHFLRQLNGFWAFIAEIGEVKIAAVDLARSIPVFVDRQTNTFCFEIENPQLSSLSSDEIALSHTLGSGTFSPNFSQLQAGQFAWASEGKPEVITYFSHFRNELDENLPHLQEQHAEVMQKLLANWRLFLNGRTAVIPLSGGLDSRLLAALLAKNKINFIAYTYGSLNGFEAKVAKEVAQKLGCKWYFVEYTRDRMQAYFDEEWKQYALLNARLSGFPQEQEYFAVKYLHENNLLPEDAVFCPGYCADVQAGSFLPNKYLQKTWWLLKESPQHYLSRRLLSKDFSEVIAQCTPAKVSSFKQLVSLSEEFVLRERESKYIINGVRCYEFFGYQWYLPFWDSAFISFWQKVPSKHRFNKQLYIQFIESEYFKSLGIDDQSLGVAATDAHEFKSFVRYLLPIRLLNWMKKWRGRSDEDVNNLWWLRNEIVERLQLKKRDMTVNEAAGNYLKFLLESEREGE